IRPGLILRRRPAGACLKHKHKMLKLKQCCNRSSRSSRLIVTSLSMVDCEKAPKQHLTTHKLWDLDPPCSGSKSFAVETLEKVFEKSNEQAKTCVGSACSHWELFDLLEGEMIKVVRITFIFCLCMTAWGQIATTTSLVGTVTDNTGAVLPDASVSAVNQENK